MRTLILLVAVVLVGGCASGPGWVSDPNDPNNVKIEKRIRSELAHLAAGGGPNRGAANVFKFYVPGQSGNQKKEKINPWYSGRNITRKDLEKVTELLLNGGRSSFLTSVKGLEKLTQLRELDLSRNQLTSVQGLEKLTQLRELSLEENKLTSVQGLEKLTQLRKLELQENKLTSVRGLEKFTQLTWLNLNRNQLTNVKGLEKLTQLEYLFLADNPALTKAQIDQLKKALPKCKINFYITK